MVKSENSLHLNVGLSERSVKEHEIREAQAAFLSGSVTNPQRDLIDACISFVCRRDWDM